MFKQLILVLGVALLAACAGGPQSVPGSDMDVADFQNRYSESADVNDLNQQILSLATEGTSPDGVYRLGVGDEISVNVFGVDDLSDNYRIDGLGRVSLPLIGNVDLSGYTLGEAEDALERLYGEQYLRNPQINVSVVTFRSQQFTAVGAISSPRVYNTERKVTLVEALAMAGGLSSNAGSTIQLTDRIRDPDTGTLGTRNLVIDVENLTRKSFENNVILGESAVINVPPAGSIFVEGAVENPGVYQARGETTVLKAITMAGGLKFEADHSGLRILRREPETGEWMQQYLNMSDLRDSPLNDMRLGDGDIVMVEKGAVKTAWVGFWRGLTGLVFLGFRPLNQ